MENALFFASCFLGLAAYAAAGKLNFTSPLPEIIKAHQRKGTDDAPHYSRRELTILAFINYGGYYLPFGPICTEPMQIALNALTENSSLSLFEKYDLAIKPYDDKCSRPDGVPLFVRTMINVDQMQNVVPLALTSPCVVTDITGAMLHHFNFVGLSLLSLKEEMFTDRNLYRSFYLILDFLKNVFLVMAQFFEANHWRKVVFISEDESFWNKQEKKLSVELDKRGISVLASVKIPPVPGSFPDVLTVMAAVEELKWLDARIIVVHSSTPSLIACSLHKYGIYGPFYSIFIYGGVYFLPNARLRYHWCTDEMLYEVLQSVFYYGDGEFSNFGTSQTPDSQGMTPAHYDYELQTRINSPENHPLWELARTFCYDLVVTAAHLLDATEQQLQKRNQTLGDWTSDSKNFKSIGPNITSVIETSLRSVNFRGVIGQIDFTEDIISSANSYPVLLQVQNFTAVKNGSKIDSKNMKLVIVAHHVSQKNTSLILGPHKVRWISRNGMPPPDSVKVVRIKEATLPPIIVLLLSGISGTLLLIQIAFLVILIVAICSQEQLMRFRKSTSWLYIWLLVGNIFMNLFVLTFIEEIVDLKEKLKGTLCSFGLWCFMIGYSLSNACPELLLELGLVFLHRRRTRLLKMANRIDVSNGGSASSRMTMLTNKTKTLFILWLAVSLFLVTALLLHKPMCRETMLTNFERSSHDLGTAFQYYIERCDFRFPPIYTKEFGVLTTWIVMQATATFRILFLSFYLRKKTVNELTRLPFVCSASYINVFAVFAGCLIVGIFSGSAHSDIRLPVTIVCLVVSSCNLGLIYRRSLRLGLWIQSKKVPLIIINKHESPEEIELAEVNQLPQFDLNVENFENIDD